MAYETNRREFLKTGTAAGLGTVLGGISLAGRAAQSEPLTKKVDLPPIDNPMKGCLRSFALI